MNDGAPEGRGIFLIAAGLAPFQPETATLRARRLVLEEISAQVEEGRSFALETTLSGRTYAQLIPEWQRAGYRVSLVFLRLLGAGRPGWPRGAGGDHPRAV